jgi:hypothetical protein
VNVLKLTENFDSPLMRTFVCDTDDAIRRLPELIGNEVMDLPPMTLSPLMIRPTLWGKITGKVILMTGRIVAIVGVFSTVDSVRASPVG